MRPAEPRKPGRGSPVLEPAAPPQKRLNSSLLFGLQFSQPVGIPVGSARYI